MSDRVLRIDIHSEVTPSGTIPLPQFVDAELQATQTLVKVNSQPMLRANDTFDCQHRPTIGSFQEPLPGGGGQGQLKNAGQCLLKINHMFVATRAGTNTSCSEGVQELSNQSTMALGGIPIVKVNGEAVLIGR